MVNHCFISYSNADGLAYARRLVGDLQGRYPDIKVWFDKDNLVPGESWDTQIVAAIRDCKCLVFLMTEDSVTDKSVCKNEWTCALKFKKPIIPLHFSPTADPPFLLNNLQFIEFLTDFDAGLAKLCDRILFFDTPQGILDQLKDRLADANRDLRRANEEDKLRIQADIIELNRQIDIQQKIVDNPWAAEEQTRRNIEAGLARERNQGQAKDAITGIKFINPRPGITPNYYQDRFVETRQIIDFLCNDSLRLMTIIGRGGVGKTALICRLLKSLEAGELPDQLGSMQVEGIVYLSDGGNHRISFANIFYDLSKLLDEKTAQELDLIYKNPQAGIEKKSRALFDKFQGRVVLLLDNFEPLVDLDSLAIRDRELDEALHAFLNGTETGVNIVITSRIPPKQLNLIQPGRQYVLILDEGLESPYAENILREIDSDGQLGLKNAPQEILDRARERTRGYPRALEALVAILRLDRYTTLAELLEKPTPDNVVQELVGEAFNRLDSDSQKVMQALAIYNRPVTPAALDYLLAPYLPAVDSASILRRLVSNLLVRRESGKFYLHPVDREYALGTLSEGDYFDFVRSRSGRDIYVFFWELVSRAPDVFSNRETFEQVAEQIGPNMLIDLANAIQDLDPDLQDRVLASYDMQDENFLDALDETLILPLVGSRYELTNRAADFFAETRKAPAEWKKLEDLSPQLAEFDLRCDAGNFDMAFYILHEIEFNYLLMWGHYRLLIELYLRLKDNLTDMELFTRCMDMLGWSYYSVGDFENAFSSYETALQVAREIEDSYLEGQTLSNLGVAYRNLADIPNAIKCYHSYLAMIQEGKDIDPMIGLANLGNAYADIGNLQQAIQTLDQALDLTHEQGQYPENFILDNLGHCYWELEQDQKAIVFHNKALLISRNIQDRRNEAICLENLGHVFTSLGNYVEAEQVYKEAILIADEILAPQVQNFARWGLAKVYLCQNNLRASRELIEAALQFYIPKNNHNVLVLYGCILLRQEDADAARQGFQQAIFQADQVLARTSNYYTALYAKGLALCGLALCVKKDVQSHQNHTEAMTDAIETFHQTHCIAPHAGVIKHNLQLFDEMAKCDTRGILKDVRQAVEGKGLPSLRQAQCGARPSP